MSKHGEPEVGQPTQEALEALLTPSPTERAALLEATSAKMMIWASRHYGRPGPLRTLAAAGFDRCFYPEGVTASSPR